jgi:hypothetical protein
MFCPNIFLQIQQKDRCMKKGRGEILPVCRWSLQTRFKRNVSKKIPIK